MSTKLLKQVHHDQLSEHAQAAKKKKKKGPAIRLLVSRLLLIIKL